MIFTESKLKGAYQIKLEPKEDFRGFFMRTYDDQEFEKHGINQNWIQEYHNLSLKKGTIRGLHFQLPPHSETKLVRALQGETLDVFVDLRKDSPTFGQWDSVVISAENKIMVYVPKGFAHGLYSLTNNAMVLCKMDNRYAPEHEYQIKWDDPDLNIAWPKDIEPTVSPKDSQAKSFKDFVATHQGM